MGFSPLANMSRRIGPAGRQSTRTSPIRGFMIHHNAGVNAYSMATDPRYQVSANYWITNEGVIIPNIDENMRAWTSGATGYPAGALSDHRNVTVEVSNSGGGPNWPISAAAERALIALIGDVYKRHNLGPVKRSTSGAGVNIHSDFVPTQCPGPTMGSRLAHIIREAEKARTASSGSTPVKGKKLRILKNHAPKRKVTAGDAVRIPLDKAGNGTLRNELDGDKVVTDTTDIDITANIRISGPAGNKLRVYGQRRKWDAKKKLWVPAASVGSKDYVIHANGSISDQFGVDTLIPKGQRILFLVKLLSGKGTSTVESVYVHGRME